MSISLFLGAGASAQFGLDTTAEFKTKLMNNKQHNPNVNQNNKHQQSTFASLINNSNFIDIEEILHAIKGLTENITNLEKERKILGIKEGQTFNSIHNFRDNCTVSQPHQLDSVRDGRKETLSSV